MVKWIKGLIGLKKPQTAEQILQNPQGKRYYSDFHNIRKNYIDDDALKVINRLQQFGHKAYLVGGGVRDLLLDRQPKDYDVVTNARPNEVRKIFANSRLIGRRFRIVHVVFRGNKIIEVSTARALPESRFLARNENELYLQKDNEYGSFKEDAARRDFTLNGLFFDVRNEAIIDYTGGYEDLKNQVIKIIGNEDVSLPEDPVRMLRAVKFAALLEMTMDPKLVKGIKKHKKFIKKASISRLHEEFNKIFRTGKTATIFQSMHENELFDAMLPKISDALNRESANKDFLETETGSMLAISDRMISEHEDVNTNIYYAILSMPVLKELLDKASKDAAGLDEDDRYAGKYDKNFEKKVKDKLQNAIKELGITKKESDRIIQMFTVQPHFHREVSERKGWVKDFKNREYFIEAFTLFKIYARARQDDNAIQKALFWEIGLRKKLPQAIRKPMIRRLRKTDRPASSNRDEGQSRGSNNQRNNKSSGGNRSNNKRGRKQVKTDKNKPRNNSGSNKSAGKARAEKSS